MARRIAVLAVMTISLAFSSLNADEKSKKDGKYWFVIETKIVKFFSPAYMAKVMEHKDEEKSEAAKSQGGNDWL